MSFEIAKGLTEKKNFKIDVVTMHYSGLPREERINENLTIYRVPSFRQKMELCEPHEQAIYLFTGLIKCLILLRRNRYDLCHTHFLIPTGILAFILKITYGLKYVVTAHGSDIPGFNKDRFLVMHRFTRPVLKAVGLKSEKVVSPSRYLAKLVLKNVSSQINQKIVHIPNGINIHRFKPQKKKNYIFASGRLLPRKGFQYLIKSVSSQNLNCELHIAGDGPHRAELEKLAARSKAKIVFHGWLDNNSTEYKNLLERAKFYSLFSSAENASIALLEAMSAGCIVIISDSPGSVETVGNAGFIVDPSKSQEYTDIIREVTKDSKLFEKYKKKSRMRVKKYFSMDICITNHANLFNKIIKSDI